MIKTISYSQVEILKDIINLHNNGDTFELDPTYSKGNFYKEIEQPTYKFDLFPQNEGVKKASAESLPIADGTISSICFDPPFIAGHTKDKPTGVIGERFHGFRYIPDLWDWYVKCLQEFERILVKNGLLVFKCQDTVSSGRQWWSHVFIINEAQKKGFYCKDIFVLLAKNRLIGHNHKRQKHARKYHSYFLVFEKKGKA